MNLNTRLNRLEAGKGQMMTPEQCQAAADRYASDHALSGGPRDITPVTFVTAITTTRSPFQQRLLACWLPGDDDI